MNAKQLAEALSITKGRVSQLVADGTLEGCYTGSGRNRTFDARKAAEVMGKRLDPGQQLGNGAASKAARQALLDAESDRDVPATPLRDGGELAADDDDRYRMARTVKAEAEARRLRRQNEEEEGRYVLAEAAAREARRLIQTEIAGFEGVIRDAARAIADEFGVDFKQARAILRQTWRTHRAGRAEELAAEVSGVSLGPDEQASDI